MAFDQSTGGEEKEDVGIGRRLFRVPTIRSNLFWLVAACVLPGLLGALVLVDYIYERERAELEQNLLQTARALGQAIDREIAIARTAAEILSGGPFFASDDLPLAYRRAGDLVDMQVGDTVVLGNRHGQQIFDTLRPFGETLPAYGDPDHLRQVFGAGKTVVSDLFIGAVSHRPVISIGVPVRQANDVKYVLSVGIVPERFDRILMAQHLPSGRIAAVLDRHGTLVARSRLPEKYVGQKSTPAILRYMEQGSDGVVETETSDGVLSYVALSRLPGTGWWVGVAAPKSGLLGAMRAVVLYASLGTAILLLIGMAVARLLGRRIANSVHALVEPALALGAGQAVAAPRLPIQETDAVARALNEASQLIQCRTAERDRACEDLRLAQAVFNNTQETIVVTDLDCRILAVNPAFCLVTEYSREEVLGRPMQILQSGRHDRSFYQQMWQSIHCTGGWQGAIWNRRKGGEIYQEWLVISTVPDELGRPAQYVGISLDMARMDHVETAMEYLAHHDALTGLPNRLLLRSRLEHSLARAHRDGACCAVLFMDLDRFKQVNDTLGHAAGDELLKLATQRMGERLRDVDTLARLGGDEFVVVLDSIANKEGAAMVAQELIAVLEGQPFRLQGGHSVRVGASVGISLYPEDGEAIDVLLARADAALYQAKGAGRGVWMLA